MRNFYTNRFHILVLMAAFLASPALAQSDDIITPGKSGDITYVTGGIGDEEIDALKSVSSRYNLHIMSASTAGEFTGDTHFTIRDKNRKKLAEADAGPLFYAMLPPGQYLIEGENAGQARSQKITIRPNKTEHIMFSWKNPD